MIFWEICLALQLAKYIFMPTTAISLDGKKVFSVKWMALVYIFYILQWFGYQPKWLNKSTCSGGLPTKIYNSGLAAHWFFSKTEENCPLHSGVSPHATGRAYCKLGKQEIASPSPESYSGGFNSCLTNFLPSEQTNFREANVCPLKIHDYSQTLSLVWKPESIRYHVIQYSGKKIFIPLPITKQLLLNPWKFSKYSSTLNLSFRKD